MIFAIDSRPLFFPPKNRSGARIWNTNLIKAISDLKTDNIFYMLCRQGEGRLLEELKLGENFIPIELKFYGDYSCYSQNLEQFFISQEIKKLNFDIYVGLYFIIPLKRDFKAVSVFDDMIPWIVLKGGCNLIPSEHTLDKEMKDFQIWKRASVENADGVIGISQATCSDLSAYWGVEKNRCKVVHPSIANNFRFRKRDELEKFRLKYNLPENYILFVSTLEARKNVKGLMEAFAKYCVKIADPLPLVLVGPKGRCYEEHFLEIVQKNGLSDFIKVYDKYVPAEDIPLFYNCATFFCFPSFYEGFGLTVLEALSSGLPVITSNTSSLPEVAGNATLYVDPWDTDLIADKMVLLSEDRNLREEYSKRALEQSTVFSFHKTAKNFIEVLKGFAGKPSTHQLYVPKNSFKTYEGCKRFLILGTATEDLIEEAIEDISNEVPEAQITVLIQKGRELKKQNLTTIDLLPKGFFNLFLIKPRLFKFLKSCEADMLLLLYNCDDSSGYIQLEILTLFSGIKKLRGFFAGRRVIKLGWGYHIKTFLFWILSGVAKPLWWLKLKTIITEQKRGGKR